MDIRNIESDYIRASDFNADVIPGDVAVICDHEATILIKKSKRDENGGNK